jgi:hypothetical protein
VQHLHLLQVLLQHTLVAVAAEQFGVLLEVAQVLHVVEHIQVMDQALLTLHQIADLVAAVPWIAAMDHHTAVQVL